MRKYIKFFLFFAFAIFMTACPYQAPFPIDKPSVEYSSVMVGKWADATEEYEEPSSHYLISAIDAYSFKVEKKTYDEEEDSWTMEEYSAHLSEVGNYKFLNLYSIEKEIYYFYKMKWNDPDNFSLNAVTEYISEEFDSSAELKVFFEKYCDLSFFYQGGERFMKVE